MINNAAVRFAHTHALPTHIVRGLRDALSQPPDTGHTLRKLPCAVYNRITQATSRFLANSLQSRNNYYNISIRQLQGRYKILPVEFFAFFRPLLVHFLQTAKIYV